MIQKADAKELSRLIELLQKEGYQVIGPTIRDQAIIYDVLTSIHDLPIGWTDEQEPGKYRLKKREDHAYFGYVVGPHSWKKYLFPPRRKLWKAEKKENKLAFYEESIQVPKLAFLGIRACEMEALFIQDKIFIEGAYVDNFYKNQRENLFLISVNCTQAASTCFCHSMQTGPKVKRGYDLTLTEVINNQEHYFVIEKGSNEGEKFLNQLHIESATEEEVDGATKKINQAIQQMEKGLGLNTEGIENILARAIESPHWDDVADRCLSCANCTMVCPTCFCSTFEEVNDLSGEHSERWKSWDSCFNGDHSYLYGGSVRASTSSRYRQWLTHKLGTWVEQFGSSGCVGCGRCISWCPVGIDIREEMAKLRLLDEEEKS